MIHSARCLSKQSQSRQTPLQSARLAGSVLDRIARRSGCYWRHVASSYIISCGSTRRSTSIPRCQNRRKRKVVLHKRGRGLHCESHLQHVWFPNSAACAAISRGTQLHCIEFTQRGDLLPRFVWRLEERRRAHKSDNPSF